MTIPWLMKSRGFLFRNKNQNTLHGFQKKNRLWRVAGGGVNQYSAETERGLAAPLLTAELPVWPKQPVRQTISVPSPG